MESREPSIFACTARTARRLSDGGLHNQARRGHVQVSLSFSPPRELLDVSAEVLSECCRFKEKEFAEFLVLFLMNVPETAETSSRSQFPVTEASTSKRCEYRKRLRDFEMIQFDPKIRGSIKKLIDEFNYY